jgi:hypothetical protein
MARQVQVILTDDLETGEVPADETVAFAFEGQAYELDLSTKNVEMFRKDMGRYVKAARKAETTTTTRTRGRGRGATSSRTGMDREQMQAVRTWAKANGYTVAERGRIPANVIEAYHSNTPNTSQPTIPTAESNTPPVPDVAVPQGPQPKAAEPKAAAPQPAVQENTDKPAKKQAPAKQAAPEKASA